MTESEEPPQNETGGGAKMTEIKRMNGLAECVGENDSEVKMLRLIGFKRRGDGGGYCVAVCHSGHHRTEQTHLAVGRPHR